MHFLIYQTITTADVVMFLFYGPAFGLRHDVMLLRKSGIEHHLDSCLSINERQFYPYRDAAYILRSWMQEAFPRVGATV